MKYPLGNTGTRPNRLDFTQSEKGEEYHLDNAQWCVSAGMDDRWHQHQYRIRVNKQFYSPNQQWHNEEDIYSFFMDKSGQTNTRIKVEINKIQILVNQYVGNAINLNTVKKVASFSPFVKTRKEEKLEEMLLYTDVAANASQPMQDFLTDKFPIGTTEEETTVKFENVYVDKYISDINGLLRYGEIINKFEELRKPLAEQLALTGMCIMEPYVHSGEYKFNPVDTEDFIWDRGARMYDLSDCGFMGYIKEMLPTEIYERWQGISDEDRQRIETNAGLFTSQFDGDDKRAPVIKMCWRDVVVDEWGYIIDEFDEIDLQRINHVFEHEDKPRYTDKDLAKIKDLSPYQLSIIRKKKGKSKAKFYTDQWRYCFYVPSSFDSALENAHGGYVLDYGIMEYQEQNLYTPHNINPPFKVGFHIYLDGDVYCPIDIAINPQRISNRIVSVVENMINNAPGQGSVIATEAILKSKDNEEEIYRKMKNNEPISISGAAFGGVQNAIGSYGANYGNAAQLMNFATTFLQTIDQITGVNEPLKGGLPGGREQLVGVMQLMIQKGSLVQERFYDAIINCFGGCYQAIATSGKRLYIQNKRKLINIIGDNTEVLELSEDMMMEDFRVSLVRGNEPEVERKNVDSMLLQLKSVDFIDQRRASMLMGRGSEDDMWKAIREYAKEKDEIQKQAEQQERQLAVSQKEEQDGMIQQQVEREDAKGVQDIIEGEKNRQAKSDDIILKGSVENKGGEK